MKTSLTFVALTLALVIAGYSQNSSQVRGVKYQPLNVKPGLWEGTSTITTSGEMPLPAEILNKLTPEQRARMEARMKANSAPHTRTTTDKSCIRKEDLEKPFNLGEAKECTWTILESTSTKAKGTLSCEAEGMKSEGNGEFYALDPEHIKGSIHTSATGGGRNMTVDGTFSSKWLGANCGDLKHD